MDDLKYRLKEMLIERLDLRHTRPEDIQDEAPLFGDGLGLASIDALELVLALENVFAVTVATRSDALQAFASVDSMAAFLTERGVDIHSDAWKQ